MRASFEPGARLGSYRTVRLRRSDERVQVWEGCLVGLSRFEEPVALVVAVGEDPALHEDFRLAARQLAALQSDGLGRVFTVDDGPFGPFYACQGFDAPDLLSVASEVGRNPPVDWAVLAALVAAATRASADLPEGLSVAFAADLVVVHPERVRLIPALASAPVALPAQLGQLLRRLTWAACDEHPEIEAIIDQCAAGAYASVADALPDLDRLAAEVTEAVATGVATRLTAASNHATARLEATPPPVPDAILRKATVVPAIPPRHLASPSGSSLAPLSAPHPVVTGPPPAPREVLPLVAPAPEPPPPAVAPPVQGVPASLPPVAAVPRPPWLTPSVAALASGGVLLLFWAFVAFEAPLPEAPPAALPGPAVPVVVPAPPAPPAPVPMVTPPLPEAERVPEPRRSPLIDADSTRLADPVPVPVPVPAEATSPPVAGLAPVRFVEPVRARSSQEVQRLLSQVEREAVALGLPSAAVKGSTGALEAELIGQFPAPQVYVLYPQTLLEVLVREGRVGATRASLAASMQRAHLERAR